MTEAIEPLRREKIVRSSLEAEVVRARRPLPVAELAESFIVAQVTLGDACRGHAPTITNAAAAGGSLPEVAEDGDAVRAVRDRVGIAA